MDEAPIMKSEVLATLIRALIMQYGPKLEPLSRQDILDALDDVRYDVAKTIIEPDLSEEKEEEPDGECV